MEYLTLLDRMKKLQKNLLIIVVSILFISGATLYFFYSKNAQVETKGGSKKIIEQTGPIRFQFGSPKE